MAYFSPFTRAWELAIGALVAVATRWLLRVPRRVGAVADLAGTGRHRLRRTRVHPEHPLPGLGRRRPGARGRSGHRRRDHRTAGGAESLLRLAPFQWMGKLSYSMYLWHWPILVIAADYAGKTSLPFPQNVFWIMVALLASIGTYLVLENPVRHAKLLTRRRWPPIVLGLALIATSFGVATLELRTHASSNTRYHATANATVAQLVDAAPSIKTLPDNLEPSLGASVHNWGTPKGRCWPTHGRDTLPACVFGDKKGTKTMVLYGDSHAGMSFAALDRIAAVHTGGW